MYMKLEESFVTVSTVLRMGEITNVVDLDSAKKVVKFYNSIKQSTFMLQLTKHAWVIELLWLI